jgi:hypothetical protein
MRTINNPPNPKRAIIGFRDTGYNLYTAVADLVDNSINARADKAIVKLWQDEAGKTHARIIDDGYGMDEDELIDAMKYGASEKEEGNELGKFGLGLKTASTSVCKNLIVLTRKDPDGPIFQASWDLDMIGGNEYDYPLEIGEAVAPFAKEFEDSVSGTGTMVCWEKIDRLGGETSAEGTNITTQVLGQYKKRLIEHLRMVFHKFLESKKFKIFYGEEELTPWNPFAKGEKTETPISIPIEIEDTNKETGEKISGKLHLDAHIIPSKYEYSTDEAKEIASLSNAKQGFYVYREDRMIVAHDWLGLFNKEVHYSLARVEMNFSSELDEFFDLDIKKSNFNIEKISPYLHRILSPYREAAGQRHRSARMRAGGGSKKDPHGPSQKLIKSKYASSTSELKVKKVGKNQVEVENKAGKTLIRIPTLEPDFSDQLIKVEESVEDGLFWSPCLLDNKIGVLINRSHPYYERVYEPNYDDSVTVRGLDSILWALAKCEQEVMNEETRRRLKDFRRMISGTLRELAEELPELQESAD